MTDIALIGSTFLTALHFSGYIIIGIIFGLFIGAVPGFSSSNGLVVILPILLNMEPTSALVFMSATYCGAEMGGSIPAILMNVPGTPGAVATCFDGYMMAKKGMGQQALSISATASGIGGILTTIPVLLALPILARIALSFGTVQNFIIIVFGITLLGKLIGGSFAKGLLMGFLGLLLGATGFDPIYSTPLATFGFKQLYDGMPPIAALVGLFAVSECLVMLEKETVVDADALQKVITQDLRASWEGVMMTIRSWKTMISSSFTGLIVGAIPGAGGAVSALIAYNQAMAANPGKKFGQGEPDGVLAPEAANNAVIAGAIIPTFTLGIPGSGTMVVILTVMQAQGFLIGPQFMTKNPEVAYTVVSSMLIGNLVLFVVSFFSSPYLARLTIIPTRILVPSIMVMSLMGAFAPRSYLFDIYLALIFGVAGYIMKKFDYPTIPLILGIVLGPYSHEYFLRALKLSHGSILIFFRDPLSLLLWGLLILSLAGPVIYKRIKHTDA